MRASIILSKLMVFAFLVAFCLSAHAASPKNYLYDTKEENGKITSKVVFLQEEGLLSKQVKYEFTYNEAGKVAEKKAYRWDKRSEDWLPYYLITYQYDSTNKEIHSTYAMWDAKKKNYVLNIQEMVLPEDSYEEIFS